MLPKVLKGAAFSMAVAGAVTAVVMVMMARLDIAYEEWDMGAIWSVAQFFTVGFACGLLWHMMVRVAERLDQTAEALERMAEQ